MTLSLLDTVSFLSGYDHQEGPNEPSLETTASNLGLFDDLQAIFGDELEARGCGHNHGYVPP
jgi:hypothetical protein